MDNTSGGVNCLLDRSRRVYGTREAQRVRDLQSYLEEVRERPALVRQGTPFEGRSGSLETEDSDDVEVELDGSEDDCEKQRPEDKEQVSGRKSQRLARGA